MSKASYIYSAHATGIRICYQNGLEPDLSDDLKRLVKYIRQAKNEDLIRIAEIEIFNYRLNFYPIFKNDEFYFCELNVPSVMTKYENSLDDFWVYDDGLVKGFMQVCNGQLKKLFVEPVLQRNGIGAELLEYAVTKLDVTSLWALEKNTRAISFYKRHGFKVTSERKFEEDTTEYLIRLER